MSQSLKNFLYAWDIFPRHGFLQSPVSMGTAAGQDDEGWLKGKVGEDTEEFLLPFKFGQRIDVYVYPEGWDFYDPLSGSVIILPGRYAKECVLIIQGF